VETMSTFFWIFLAFFSGALPTAVWVGRFGLGVEITAYGDGNPGATNVYRAGGFLWFSLALALEISKAAAPVGLAVQIFGLDRLASGADRACPGRRARLFTVSRLARRQIDRRGAGRLDRADLVDNAAAGHSFALFFALLVRPSGWAVLLYASGDAARDPVLAG
jgi:hypothetical protein